MVEQTRRFLSLLYNKIYGEAAPIRPKNVSLVTAVRDREAIGPLGAAVAVIGLVTDGPQLATYHWRGPLFVSLAILAFAVSIRPLGLVVTGLASFLIAALGTHETRWGETLIVGICLTAARALMFPYVLGLPMPLLPRFVVQ